MTVLEAIQRSVDFLAKKGVDSPRLQAELLLAHLLKVQRMKLYLDFERALTAQEQADFRELIRRRGQREPLQHIIGSTSFCGLEMTVNRDVLVPRPETELLAEAGWQYLNSPETHALSPALSPGERENEDVSRTRIEAVKMAEESRSPSALDFGTGSGCLAIALAVKCLAARVAAIDVSPAALEVARQNAARNKVESRIEFLLGDGFAALPAGAQFDLIISNPPYIPSGEIGGLQAEVRDYDPRAALDGGTDGLDFYRRLAGEAAAFLRPEGRLMVEFGDGQEGALQKLFAEQKWIVETVRPDYNRKPRLLFARRATE